MSIPFHLVAKDRAQHDMILKPKSSIEVEITDSLFSGVGNSGGSFELQLFRWNEIAGEWEMVGTASVGVGLQTRTLFDELSSDRGYAIGVFYKNYGDAIDSELQVDGNIIVH